MSDDVFSPEERGILYEASLSGTSWLEIASLLGVPYKLVEFHLRHIPRSRQLKFLLEREASRALADASRPQPVGEIDVQGSLPTVLYVTARAVGTASLTRAADAYQRAVGKLRAALTAEQARIKDREARRTHIIRLEAKIDALRDVINNTYAEIARVREGKTE